MSEMVTLWLVVLIVSIGVEVATLGLRASGSPEAPLWQ